MDADRTAVNDCADRMSLTVVPPLMEARDLFVHPEGIESASAMDHRSRIDARFIIGPLTRAIARTRASLCVALMRVLAG